MTNFLVSVIIPVYNRSDKLSTAIKSVLNQSYVSLELIVVDDGSTDNVAEVVSRFPQVKYVTQEHSGQATARNRGLQKAKGCFIASLDSDDTWDNNFLDKLVTKMEKDRLDFAFANWWQKTTYGKSRDYLRTYPHLVPFLKNIQNGWVNLSYADLRSIYLAGCPSPSSSALIRRSAIINGWEPNMNIGDDWCLFLDIILKKECKAAFCLENLWIKNVGADNVYDGRAWNEVTELLYVKDLQKLMNRYHFLLHSKEIKQLEKLYVENILTLAIYKLLKKRNPLQFFRLINQSFHLGISKTLTAFPNTLQYCFSRAFKAINEPLPNPALTP